MSKRLVARKTNPSTVTIPTNSPTKILAKIAKNPCDPKLKIIIGEVTKYADNVTALISPKNSPSIFFRVTEKFFEKLMIPMVAAKESWKLMFVIKSGENKSIALAVNSKEVRFILGFPSNDAKIIPIIIIPALSAEIFVVPTNKR